MSKYGKRYNYLDTVGEDFNPDYTEYLRPFPLLLPRLLSPPLAGGVGGVRGGGRIKGGSCVLKVCK